MRFWGFGKKPAPDVPEQSSVSPIYQDVTPSTRATKEVIVYGTSDGTRCRQVRTLLEKHGYTFKDVRIDDDLGTRSWLQRTTGDDALPKVFVGSQCYGGFEALQVLVFDGTFSRILRGEVDTERTDEAVAILKKERSISALAALLRRGEILTIKESGMEMDAWAEPLANPPLVYYEGAPHPIAELEGIVEQIIARVEAGDLEIRWKEND
jgi:glutaredoxin